jgi:segregation and condensation protein B
LGIEIATRPLDLDLPAQVEAVIFASPNPIKASDVQTILSHFDLNCQLRDVEGAIQMLIEAHDQRHGGFRLAEVQGEGYQFQTVPQATGLMERMFSTRPRPLSRAALETLAILAYRQPSTRADVEKVRGVDTGSIIKTLLDRGLIRCAGRREDAGRPMLFETDQEFLRVFGLTTLSELPPIHAFQPVPDVMKEAQRHLEGAESQISAEALTIPGEISERPELPELSP